MRAGLITGARTLELREFPWPQPASGRVVVSIDACGICGTDVHAYASGSPYPAAVCGHEWAGTVSAIGAGVTALTEGDRVVVAVPPACGRCDACHAGQTRHCVTTLLASLGADADAPPHGGFAPAIEVSPGRVVRCDPRLTPRQAAQVEPAAVTFHAVRASALRLGDVAVVQGAGPIGLLTVQWARAAGASWVLAVEPHPDRQKLALALGADAVAGPGADARAVLDEQTRGLGADVVYECVGRADAVQSGADLARRGGALCLIGLANGPAPIDPGTWLIKELRLTAALAYLHEEFAPVMAMIADGRIDVDRIADQTVGLDDLDSTLGQLADGTAGATKILVDPNL